MRRKPLRKLPESGNSQAEGSVFALLGHDFDIFAVIEQAHKTAQPVAVPCGVPPPLPYHYTECACASQVTIKYLSDFSFDQYLPFAVQLGYNEGAAAAKGALVITPDKVIVTTPGAENKKVL